MNVFTSWTKDKKNPPSIDIAEILTQNSEAVEDKQLLIEDLVKAESNNSNLESASEIIDISEDKIVELLADEFMSNKLILSLLSKKIADKLMNRLVDNKSVPENLLINNNHINELVQSFIEKVKPILEGEFIKTIQSINKVGRSENVS
ncbi:MAG: hypothetical protein K2P99_01825 [Burkholderiales bacterium]|nr:hypothetical protein [Burkholderiales bacterium]